MKINIKDLTTTELIYLAEYMICVLDCRARNDDGIYDLRFRLQSQKR